MSETIAPSHWEQVTLPNPSISSSKWHFSDNDKDGVAKTIESFGLVVAIFGFLLLFGRIGPFPELMSNGVVFLAFFISTFVAALFFLPKVSKRVIASRERKRDEYRAQHAHIIIDAVGEQGWTILGKNPVETLIKDNNPYMENSDGIRYYARQVYIGRENIDVMLKLSDPEAERAIKESEKQRRIQFEVNVYERANGPMTPEEKAAFVAALTISL
jgi:hypothetical protein